MIWAVLVIGLWLGAAMVAFVLTAVAGGRQEDRQRCRLVYGLALDLAPCDVDSITR
jgi:hypothetical protein